MIENSLEGKYSIIINMKWGCYIYISFQVFLKIENKNKTQM